MFTSSVSFIPRQSLGLTVYKKDKVQNLSESDKQKCLHKIKKLLRCTKTCKVNKTSFTDEKLFKLYNPSNMQYDYVYAQNKE